MNHAETAPDFPNGGAPGSRAIGVISAVLIALRLISLGRLLQRFGAEVLRFTSSRNSNKYMREMLA